MAVNEFSKRDGAVDAFRGLAIVGMILVNHAPPNGEMFSPFVHAEWTGWTLADVIFPAFLFLVGYSINLSADRQPTAAVPWGRIWRRALILLLLSIILVNFPYYDPENFVLHGTLFRIGVCYLAAVSLYYLAPPRIRVYCLALVLGLQLGLLILVPTNRPMLDPWELDLTASIVLDSMVFGSAKSMLILNGSVPQGIVPTLGAIASTFSGLIAGHYIKKYQDFTSRSAVLLVSGFILTATGMALADFVPLSKPIWTPSYVVFMAGLSLQIMGVFNWLINVGPHIAKATLLRVAGTNALAFYILAQCAQRVLVYGKISVQGEPIQLRNLIYDYLFAPFFPEKFGSLLYTCIFLMACYTVIYWMYRREIYIRL